MVFTKNISKEKLIRLANNNSWKLFYFFLIFGMGTLVLLKSNELSWLMFDMELKGDEHVFVPAFEQFKHELAYHQKSFPYTYFFIAKLLSFLVEDDLLCLRFTSLIFSLSAAVLMFTAAYKKYYLKKSLVFLLFLILVFLEYPILYSATEDSTLLFFVLLTFTIRFLHDGRWHYLLYGIGLALIFSTKNAGLFFIVAFLCIDILQFILGKRLNQKKLLNTWLMLFIYMSSIVIFTAGPHIDKGSIAGGYESASWGDVRFLSAHAKYNNELTKHRLLPKEYKAYLKAKQIDLPNGKLDIIYKYPEVFIHDKIIKIVNLFRPHMVFGLIITLSFFWFFFKLSVRREIDLVVIFGFIPIMGILLYIIGYFENRWILAVFILFSFSSIDWRPGQALNMKSVSIFEINILIIMLKNRHLFIDAFQEFLIY